MSSIRGKKPYDTTFLIIWNAERRTFDIQQDGKPTGSFARDRHTAIGLACKAAQFASHEGKKAVVFSVNSDGKQVAEWSATT